MQRGQSSLWKRSTATLDVAELLNAALYWKTQVAERPKGLFDELTELVEDGQSENCSVLSSRYLETFSPPTGTRPIRRLDIFWTYFLRRCLSKFFNFVIGHSFYFLSLSNPNTVGHFDLGF